VRPDEIAKALGADEVIRLDPQNPVADGLRVHRERAGSRSGGEVTVTTRHKTLGEWIEELKKLPQDMIVTTYRVPAAGHVAIVPPNDRHSPTPANYVLYTGVGTDVHFLSAPGPVTLS